MMTVDKEDFEAVRHLLPESVLALITIIGLTETVELVKNLGGTTYPLRQGRTKGSESRLAYLEEIVGGAAMEKMVEALAPCDLFVPKCEQALLELRDRHIRRRFDAQTGKGVPAYEAVNDLALAHGLTDRHIWRILKKPDNEGVQEGLF